MNSSCTAQGGNGPSPVGALEVIQLMPAESDLFVEFARLLDDGEASTLAVGAGRRMLVATDDTKATRVAASHVPAINVVGRPTIIKRWHDRRDASDASLDEVLERIETDASFVPRKKDSLETWWRERGEETSAASSV